MLKICLGCKQPFDARRSNLVCCSNACRILSIRGKPRASRGGHVTKSGYRLLSIGQRHIFEHRYVMEQFLGQRLAPNERVHHIDGNRLNNALENLAIVSSQREHSDLHCGARTEDSKQCSKCKEIKPRSEFYARYKESPNSDDHVSHCKECYRKRDRRAHPK